MAAATPDDRFQKLREENERRRKKREEEEKRRKQEDEQKAKEALERRRMERLEHDERMRKPWQQPPAPKKEILRKGAKQKVVQPGSPKVDPVRQSQAEERRREQRQGLQAFIRQQRQAAVVAKVAKPEKPESGPPVVPLTWEELRLAAAAGFDELLRQQDLEEEQRAREEPRTRAARHRTPSKSPFRGPPAPMQEVVQIELVPSGTAGGTLAAAPGSGLTRSSEVAASEPSRSLEGPRGDGGVVAEAGVSPHGVNHIAALRNSYKFSDAPASPAAAAATARRSPSGSGDGLDGSVAAGASYTATSDVAAGGGQDPDASPAAVLYPPPGEIEAAPGGSTGSAARPMADGALSAAASSVGSSGGLRRGVTAATRYRALPIDAASLDEQAAAQAGGWPQGMAGGQRSPRSSGGQRLAQPGPYDDPSPQPWPVPNDPLEASLLAGGALAALQEADGFRLASPRSSAQPPQQREQPWRQNQQQPHAPNGPAPQGHPQAATRADGRPARRGWALPPQAAAMQEASGWGSESSVVDTSLQGTEESPALLRTSVRLTAAADTKPIGATALYGSVQDAAGNTPLPSGLAQSAVLSQAPSPLRHSIGVGDSGGPEMWQRGSVAMDANQRQPPYRAGDNAGLQTPSPLPYVGPGDAADDCVRFSSPLEIEQEQQQLANRLQSQRAIGTSPVAGEQASLLEEGRAEGEGPQQEHGAGSALHGRRELPLLAGQTEKARASRASLIRPGSAESVSPKATGELADASSASPPAGADQQNAPKATEGAGQELVPDHTPGLCGTPPDSQEPPQLQYQAEGTASIVPHPHEQPPLLPPIAVPRPSSGSARLPPLPNGHQAVPPPASLPPLHTPGYAAHSGSPVNANSAQPRRSVEMASDLKPQPPPLRAPSPPASPPRSITPQRFHRQLSASALSAANAGAAVPQVGSTPPRPLSADLVSATVSTVQSRPPPHAPLAAPPEERRAPPPAVTVPEPAPPAPAVPAPISPRKPGVVAVTPASPSRHASRPLQTPAFTPSQAVMGSGPWDSRHLAAPAAVPQAFEASVAPADAVIGTSGPSQYAVSIGSGAKASSANLQRPATAASPTEPSAASRCTHATIDPPTVAEEPSEEDVAATAAQQSGGGLAERSVFSGSPLERPPSTAEGSVMSGSHISARPGSGSASLSGYGTRPGTGQGPCWGSGYQASVLDDSVSSFDFRVRSTAASRPASGTCAPASPPPQLLIPYAAVNVGKPRTETCVEAAAAAASPLPASNRASTETENLLSRSRAGESMEQQVARDRGSAAAYGSVLHPPAGGGKPFGWGDDDDGNGGPPFAEEGLMESGEEERSQLTSATASAGVVPSALPAAASAGSAGPDLDDLMREIQELSALRKALKAEFESMGRGEAAAALGTLSANFAPPGSAGVDGAAGAMGMYPLQVAAAAPRANELACAPHAAVPPAPAPLAPAPPAPAPLLQWSVPNAAGETNPGAAAAPGTTASHTTQLPAQPSSQGPPLPTQLGMQQRIQQSCSPGAEEPAGVIAAVPGTAGVTAGATLVPMAQVLPKAPATEQRPAPATDAWSPAQLSSAAGTAATDVHGQSFAFASPGHAASAGFAGGIVSAFPIEAAMMAPLPIAPPVLPAAPMEAASPTPPPAAQAQSPPLAALQWTIPVNTAGDTSRGSANGVPPQQAPRSSAGPGVTSPHGAAASASGPTSASGCSTPTKAASQQKRGTSGAGYATAVATGSSISGGTRSGTVQLSAASSSRAGAALTPTTERPLVNEGSYVQAALQARERAERERAAREALQAESAAAKAAALSRSKSDRAAMAVAAGAASPSGAAASKDASPLGPKAPSSIGSYVRQPAPAASRTPEKPVLTGRGSGGVDYTVSEVPSATGTPAGGSTPDASNASSAAKQAWGTPTRSRPSRIPTPPRGAVSTATATGSGVATSNALTPSAAPAPPARRDSLDSDLDFLERAWDVSDTETDSPSAYGVSDAKSAPPPQRSTFAPTSAAPSCASRERLEGGRPRPLHIPASGAATPMGGASTSSTVASRAVPTGGKGPSGGGAAGGGRGKQSTPFTAAIRELMGLPGSAPLEQARPVAAGPGTGRSSSSRAAGGPWPERLSAEEEQLLASLQRLDTDILRKGLMAAGIISEPSAVMAQGGGAPAKAAAGKGRAAGAPGGKAAGGAKASGPLTNSLQQDQLRESLEKLDVRLGALRRKMEDRACMLGVPIAAAGTPAAATTGDSAPARTQRDATPPKEDRRGPPATLAKSRTPTPNKAKAIRDQRQQQLSGAQGPTPQPVRAPPPAGPPKPASAPVAGAHGVGRDAQVQPSLTVAAGAGATMQKASQPHGIPPRAPAPKAPASAPSDPTPAGNAAGQQQLQQQAFGAGTPYGMSPGPNPMFPMPYGAMPMYGGPPAAMAPDAQGQRPQPQQVAYVAAMLPNGQVAYVPQYVGPVTAGGFPGYMQAPLQQPHMMMMGQGQPQQAPLAPPGFLFPGTPMQQQQGGPMMAWAAEPQVSAPQHPSPALAHDAPPPQHHHGSGGGSGNGARSLYSFDRSGSAGQGMGAAPHGAAVHDTPGSGGNAAAYGFASHDQGHPSAGLPYATSPPPTGPLPHYHSTVMRTRSFGSRDGEAAVAAAAMAAGMGHAANDHHHQQSEDSHTVQFHARQAVQTSQQPGEHRAPRQSGEALAQQSGQHQASPSPQPHSVQFQSFGPKASSRGVGAPAGWGPSGAGAGAGSGSTADGGVIKAVNLGLLLS